MDSKFNWIHYAGPSFAVWEVGNAFCKVNAWYGCMELESYTIHYVKENSSVPVPEVVYPVD
jgi:hypothetical protein